MDNTPARLLPRETFSALARSARTLARCSTATARTKIPLEFAIRYCLLPITWIEEVSRGAILAAIVPATLGVREQNEIRALLGVELELEYHDGEILEQAIHLAYHGTSTELVASIQSIAATLSTSVPDRTPSADLGDIPKLLNAIVCHAWSLSASDIHVEPSDNNAHVRFRVNGALEEQASLRLPIPVYRNLVRRVKILSHLDITRSDIPFDGAFVYHMPHTAIRLRVSLLPQLRGEKLVLRLAAEEEAIREERPALSRTLLGLGMSPLQSEVFEGFLELESGCALLSGPTGSGKTTLLYTALGALSQPDTHIVTLEDPVERRLPWVTQVEIRTDSGWGYPELLRAVLRQDPDVILVGEIRDSATAETTLHAAMTGHLVLSTIHSGNCLEALIRLQALVADFSLIESALKLLVSQRLLPTVCPHCAEFTRATPRLSQIFQLDENCTVSFARGCNECRGTAVAGRIGVFELLPFTARIREQVGELFSAHHRLPLQELTLIARENNFRPFAYQVREALICGKISPEAACKALGVSATMYSKTS